MLYLVYGMLCVIWCAMVDMFWCACMYVMHILFVMHCISLGNGRRSQAATAANEVSSRSHAVLQVTVEKRERAPGTVANIKVCMYNDV